MRNRILLGIVCVVAVLAGVLSQADDNVAQFDFAQWRFPVGISYISGFSDIVSFYEDEYGADASGFVPIGLSCTPYYQFAHGSRIGFDLGPAGIVIVTGGADAFYWDVPAALSYGFNFIPHGSVSPYARIGAKYHFAGGDNVEGSTPGAYAAVGVELLRKKKVGIQAEIGYDSSEVTLKRDSGDYDYHYGYRSYSREEKVTPGGVLVSVRAVF
jgi:hypothetical protein